MLNRALLLAAATRPLAGGTAFAPSDIAGLALWLDADDAATITKDAGNRVSQWADKSGNAAHAEQANASYQPLYVAAAINGRGGVDFAEDYFDLPDLASISGSQSRSVFVVAQRNSSTDDDHYVSLGAELTGQSWRFRTSGANLRIEIQGSGYTTSLAPSVAVCQVACILNGMTLGDHTLWLNGDTSESASGSSGVNTGSGQASVAGLNRSSTVPSKRMDGLIAEILMYDSALATNDRQRTEGYLAHRWGIEGLLPTGHPYKSAPPLAQS